MSEIYFEKEILWDGEYLAVSAITPAGRILCEISRNTIHSVQLYSDIITREIARDREEIVERLRPFIMARIVRAEGPSIRLDPSHLPEGF